MTVTLPAVISEVNKVFLHILRLTNGEEVESSLDQGLDQTEEEKHCQEPSVGEIGHSDSPIATNPLSKLDIQLLRFLSFLFNQI